MKIVDRYDIVDVGSFPTSSEWATACQQVETAVLATDWPRGSGTFTIYPERGRRRGEGNGVVPIKIPCIEALRRFGWETESFPVIPGGVIRKTPRTGDLDALLATSAGYVGFEWETGNISSSHRAINKLLLTMLIGGIVGGFLVVPSRPFAVYLTDRIGNIAELLPYFPLWKSIPICGKASPSPRESSGSSWSSTMA